MKAQSDQKPKRFIKSCNKTQFAYNIHEVTIEDPDTTPRTAYEYNYIEIEGEVTKTKIIAAMCDTELEVVGAFTADEVESQYKDSKDTMDLSDISGISYEQLDTYIKNNVTDLASAKIYLKKLSKVVLAMLKRQNIG